MEESNVSAELIALRKRLVEEWNAYRAKCRRELAEDKLDVSRGIQREVMFRIACQWQGVD